VRVHAASPDGAYLTRATTAADGAFSLTVPAGEDVELHYVRTGDRTVGPVAVAAGDDPPPLVLDAAARLQVTVADAVGAPSPARVQVVPEAAGAGLPRSFGEPSPANGRLHVAYVGADGEVELRVPPGRHRVVVSRGYEYELVSQDVDVGSGETATVDAVLERVVDSPGVMCGDFHIHTHRSPDSPDPGLVKVRSAVADGLEIPVRSDHEWVRDFEPEIAELGLGDFAFGVGSIELTTFSWGHFGAFPLAPMPDMANDGAFWWAGRTPPEVFAEVRARTGPAGAATLIINHPRGQAAGAYFTAAGYDPLTGSVDRTEYWDEEFGLVEVFNDSDFDESLEVVDDWFSLLSSGRRVFAVGSSDSHRIRSSPVGYPRTCIELGVDDAPSLRAMGAGVVRDQLSAGHATVNGGVYVTVAARGGAGPGDEVTGAAETELVRVVVQAPSWVVVDRLRVFADGALVETLPVDDTTIDPVVPSTRFDADVAVPVAMGSLPSWVVVVADGDSTLDPVHPGRRPFAVSNPIFFLR
jgi:hypothetical protein